MALRVRRARPLAKYAKLIRNLQKQISPDDDIAIEGDWFIAFDGQTPVGIAGIRNAYTQVGYAYLSFAGVLPQWRGKGLHKRLIKARERLAKKTGKLGLLTDTRPSAGIETVISSNNLQKQGFKVFYPKKPWGFNDAVYWRKTF